MHTVLEARRPVMPDTSDTALPHELERVLTLVRDLQRPERAARLLGALKGKNLALLSDAPDGRDAFLFTRAAISLGARVSHVQPALGEGSDARDIEDTARMLGRLYDAIECQRVPPALVQSIREFAGVPVFDGLASGAPAPAAFAARLRALGAPPADAQRLLLQARLIAAIG